jgi:hypothetical protein
MSWLIILGCALVGLLLLSCVFGKCGVVIRSDEHGSHVSFGINHGSSGPTRGAAAAAGTTEMAGQQHQAAPAAAYQGKVADMDFDAMFTEQQ